MDDTEFGLGASVFTNARERAERILAQLDVGNAYWNTSDRSCVRLPWAGRRHSGTGVSMSPSGVRALVREKSWHLARTRLTGVCRGRFPASQTPPAWGGGLRLGDGGGVLAGQDADGRVVDGDRRRREVFRLGLGHGRCRRGRQRRRVVHDGLRRGVLHDRRRCGGRRRCRGRREVRVRHHCCSRRNGDRSCRRRGDRSGRDRRRCLRGRTARGCLRGVYAGQRGDTGGQPGNRKHDRAAQQLAMQRAALRHVYNRVRP